MEDLYRLVQEVEQRSDVLADERRLATIAAENVSELIAPSTITPNQLAAVIYAVYHGKVSI